MNQHAAHVRNCLREQFNVPKSKLLWTHKHIGTVPLGIEVEVSWKSYFPDLWVEGFPSQVSPEKLQEITATCSERERLLLPLLNKTVECGVQRGTDKYWEFAFPPTTDVVVTCDQVKILQHAQLIPKGNHSLHVTIGGVIPNQDVGLVLLTTGF